MTKHMKLSDVEAQKIYLFREPTTFENAFPNVSHARVEVRIQGEEPDPAPGHPDRVSIYSSNGRIPPIINCQNPRCYGGGLDVDRELRWLTEQRRTEFAEIISCRGHEGSPKGRRNDGPCDTSFGVKITIEYKEAKPSSTNPREQAARRYHLNSGRDTGGRDRRKDRSVGS